jgi:nucleoid-associated protein EbfC
MPIDDQVDFAALAQRARRLHVEVAQAQAELATLRATGHGGGGLVTATVSGEGTAVALRIDPSIIDPDDPETLADTVLAALQEANRALSELRAERLDTVADDLRGMIAGLRRPAVRPR